MKRIEKPIEFLRSTLFMSGEPEQALDQIVGNVRDPEWGRDSIYYYGGIQEEEQIVLISQAMIRCFNQDLNKKITIDTLPDGYAFRAVNNPTVVEFMRIRGFIEGMIASFV